MHCIGTALVTGKKLPFIIPIVRATVFAGAFFGTALPDNIFTSSINRLTVDQIVSRRHADAVFLNRCNEVTTVEAVWAF